MLSINSLSRNLSIIFLITCFLGQSANANLIPITTDILQQAEQQNLAQHPIWLKLLYYPQKQKKSRVANGDFFVHPQGNQNPKAELDAMLHALLEPNQADSHSVQCRFPARTHWLRQTLNLSLPQVNCPEFQQWLDQIKPTSATLIFAEEYLKNPVSAFAHIFLQFDHQDDPQKNQILNYMPHRNPKLSMIKYTYQGFTGIDGQFTLEPYQQKIQQYRDKQGRDIWQFRLQLTDDELQQLVHQVWEIQSQTLTYRLLTDNCASEILVLLNNLRENSDLINDFRYAITPTGMIRHLATSGWLDTKHIHFEPSQKSKQQSIKNQQNHPNFLTFDNINTPPTRANDLSRIAIGIGKNNGQTVTNLDYRLVYRDDLDRQIGYPIGYQLQALSLTAQIPIDQPKNAQIQQFTILKARDYNPINTAYHGKTWGGDIGFVRTDEHPSLALQTKAEYGISFAYGQPNSQYETLPNICHLLAIGNLQFHPKIDKGYRFGLGVDVGCYQQFSKNLRGQINLQLPYWQHLHALGNGNWRPKLSTGLQYDIKPNQGLRLTWDKTKNQTNYQLQYLKYF